MRLVNAAVVSLTIVAGACSGASANGAGQSSLVTPARAPHVDPVATKGGGAELAAETAPGSAAESPGVRRVHEVTIPAGTVLPIVLDTPVGSDTSRVEQAVAAHLSRPITFHGETVLPAGSRVRCGVTDARQSGRVKGRAHLAVRFDSLSPRGDDERYGIRTASIGRTAEATKKKDAIEIAAP